MKNTKDNKICEKYNYIERIKKLILSKDKSFKSVATKIAVTVLFLLIAASILYLLWLFVISPLTFRNNIDKIQEVYYNINSEQEDTASTSDEATSTFDWSSVKSINKEIVGWLKIEGTPVDYPVLFHQKDNLESQFYLYRDYNKKPSDHGSLFVDYRCDKGIASQNVIIHGHNMAVDNSMFGSLIDYAKTDGYIKGNEEYYKKAPYISLNTPQGEQKYVIFSVIKVDGEKKHSEIINYIQGSFDSDARFMNYIYNIKELSYLNIDIPINENDKLITLSTCSYENDNMRTVVIGRMLRTNEDVSKYINNVKTNTPSVPTSTFSQEIATLNWYDGKGNLEGDEELLYFQNEELCKVTFVDSNGTAIDIQKVKSGGAAIEPDVKPKKAATSAHFFIFIGWDKDFSCITEDTIVKPVFKEILKSGNTIQSETQDDESTTLTEIETQTDIAETTDYTETITENQHSESEYTSQPFEEST